MDSARRGSPGACSSCCDCLVPVRCVIDQHEVEIIPASARSSTSNEYTTRGGSSLDSTSRTAYGSSSYRNQQHQQLSQRAAAAGTSRASGLFYAAAAHQDSSSFGQAQEVMSYRSAAPSELFGDSRQVSWDSKAPRVPLINLRKIQQHGTSIPCSPVDSERLAAVNNPDGTSRKEGGRCVPGRLPANDGPAGAFNSPGAEKVIWEQQSPSEVLLDSPQEAGGLSLASSDSASQCGPKDSWGVTSAQTEKGSDTCSSSSNSSSDSRKPQAAAPEAGDAPMDIQCFALGAAEPRHPFPLWSWLSGSAGAAAEGPNHHGGPEANAKTTGKKYSATRFDGDYAADAFPFLGVDFACRQMKTAARKERGALETATVAARGAPERARAPYDRAPTTLLALPPDEARETNSLEGPRMRTTRQEAKEPRTQTWEANTSVDAGVAVVRR